MVTTLQYLTTSITIAALQVVLAALQGVLESMRHPDFVTEYIRHQVEAMLWLKDSIKSKKHQYRTNFS